MKIVFLPIRWYCWHGSPGKLWNSLHTSADLETFPHFVAFRHSPKLFKLVPSHLQHKSGIFSKYSKHTHIHTERKLENQNGLVLPSKFYQSLVAGVSSKACSFASRVSVPLCFHPKPTNKYIKFHNNGSQKFPAPKLIKSKAITQLKNEII